MILDHLSVLSDEVSDKLVEALDWCVKNGFKYVEIRMVDGANVANLDDAAVARAKSEIDKRKLTVSAIASPLFKCALDPKRPVETGDLFGNKEEPLETHFAKLPRAIEIAKKLGTKQIRIFSFWREKEPRKYFPEIVEHLKKAAALAEAVRQRGHRDVPELPAVGEPVELCPRVSARIEQRHHEPGGRPAGGRRAHGARAQVVTPLVRDITSDVREPEARGRHQRCGGPTRRTRLPARERAPNSEHRHEQDRVAQRPSEERPRPLLSRHRDVTHAAPSSREF